MKQDDVLKCGSYFTLNRHQSMAGQQELISSFCTEHVNPHQIRSEGRCMKPIDANCVDGLKGRKRKASVGYEATISSKVCDRPARLDTPNHIVLCRLPELNR